MADPNSSKPRDEPVFVQGQDEFQTMVGNESVVLVDFYADWCGPCKMLEPVVESIAAETDATVAKVDVDSNQQLAAAHGVRGVPTLELYHDGEQVEQIVGVQSEDQLRNLIQRYET
jgi:thioredoxin 1